MQTMTLLAVQALRAGPALPDLPIPADRVIVFDDRKVKRDAKTFPIAAESIDPGDMTYFVFDLDPLLEEGEGFTEITFSVPPESGALGLTILEEPPHQARFIGDNRVLLWLDINGKYEHDRAFAGSGVVCSIEFYGRTTFGGLWERTGGVRIHQK